MTVRAVWNGVVIAQSDDTVVVDGNIYFPADALRREFLTASTTRTWCPWKGVASYYTVTVDGRENRDAAWYYPEPKPAAEAVADRVAFWRGVVIEGDAPGGLPAGRRDYRRVPGGAGRSPGLWTRCCRIARTAAVRAAVGARRVSRT
jgi:uncharacterized protein (DUF427 family)